jgi:hypothetical protein
LSPLPGIGGENPLLSGLFGVLQTAATQRLSTEDVWSSLRQAAGSWAFQAAGGGPTPSIADLEALGTRILSEQGVGIQQVNSYRALAGTWRQAAANAQNLPADQQILAQDIFVPPWAKTTAAGVPSEYRVRVQWQVQPTVGEAFTTWGTYQLTSPLTTIADVLTQAQGLVGKKPTSATPPGANITGIVSYEIEQV